MRKCYIVSRESLNNGSLTMFLSSEYPCTLRDIVNTRDHLVATFRGETFHQAHNTALQWLNEQVNYLNKATNPLDN